MDKNAIKKYAIWARRELISRVSQKALQYGISEENIGDVNADTINGHLLTAAEQKQRQALIAKIKKDGYQQAMEEAAYTWFNRFCALRYMEVNGYLPTRVRVFTDEQNNFKPQIITEAIHLELDGLDMEKVYALKEENKTEELYKYLLITQCNALSAILPGLFQKIADYTELLFPDNLLREGSVIEQMIALILEEDWTDQVQIIGWLYQYYNTEPKDQVFANLKKNIKISKENIPAATQLFTPDWIVHYMVENSLGRLWVEGHPNDEMKAGWKYYLEEAEQEPEVQKQLETMRAEYAQMKPEDILCIDPCMGSGHILVVLFDVLVQIYESYGYSAREAAAMIVEHNLWGLDIDERAAQLSYFAVMMKARQYDRRFFSRKVYPHVYAIVESNDIDEFTLEYFVNGDAKLKKSMDILMEELRDAKEYGSILNVTMLDFPALYARLSEIEEDISMHRESALNTIKPLIHVAEALAQKYSVTCTNPPYMEISSGSRKLVSYVNSNYIGGKTDMFAVFIERCASLSNANGFFAMITQPSLTSLVSFEKIRVKLIKEKTFSNLIHMGRGIFGIDFGSVSFVVRNSHVGNYTAKYMKLYERTFQYLQPEDIRDIYLNAKKDEQYKVAFENYDTTNGTNNISSSEGNQILFMAKQDEFLSVPGIPFAYTMSEKMLKAYEDGVLGDYFVTREGMATAGNDIFLRMWYEVRLSDIGFDYPNAKTAETSEKKWFPYNKGGDYRKWYGNNDYVVDWEGDGCRIRNNVDKKTGRVRSHNYNGEYAFKKGLTWSSISAGDISIRWSEQGFLFDSKGAKGFANDEDEMLAILSYLNSSVAMSYLKVISPTMDFKVGDIIQLPLKDGLLSNKELQSLARENIGIMRKIWDFSETSWDFKGFSLTKSGETLLKDDVKNIISSNIELRLQLKANEEKINRIIMELFEFTDEARITISEENLSISIPDEQDVIRDLISYAVGCMFGRYSLDIEGLIYAGGEWDANKYDTFIPDKDNIIPVCDDDYFNDDISGRFVKWVETVYGKNSLEENLTFIASILGGKGSARDIIRKYFLDDFYKDHCNKYQITGSGKRPIYWLFDSGKKGGFKALIYMHRYQPDIIARIRTDYVHEQQSRYRTAIADLQQRINGASTGERVKLTKQFTKLEAQAEEIRTYEEKIHHLADQMIPIDLDDGVKVNYAKFVDVLAKIK